MFAAAFQTEAKTNQINVGKFKEGKFNLQRHVTKLQSPPNVFLITLLASFTPHRGSMSNFLTVESSAINDPMETSFVVPVVRDFDLYWEFLRL